jgi:pimeloyl-ACP methyl ester carboxylesterase
MSKTILFIHGAWVTPISWTNFRAYFEAQGYRCEAPAWPYLDRSPSELRLSPDPRLANVTIKALVDHFEQHIKALPEPPILIGHSFGGLIVQMLLDRGLGAAGVAIDAGPPRWVLPSPRAILSALPVLLAWLGWRRVLTMSFKSFSTTFANSLPQNEQRQAYDDHIVPTPGRIFFQAALGIGNGVNFANPKRPPMLLIAGGRDYTSTASMVRAMYRKHSRAPARTDFISFANQSHWLIAEPGWEEVAKSAAEWIDKLEV